LASALSLLLSDFSSGRFASLLLSVFYYFSASSSFDFYDLPGCVFSLPLVAAFFVELPCLACFSCCCSLFLALASSIDANRAARLYELSPSSSKIGCGVL